MQILRNLQQFILAISPILWYTNYMIRYYTSYNENLGRNVFLRHILLTNPDGTPKKDSGKRSYFSEALLPSNKPDCAPIQIGWIVYNIAPSGQDTEKEAKISRLNVVDKLEKENIQKNGIGTTLIRLAKSHCAEEAVKYISLYADPDKRYINNRDLGKFYNNEGFVKCKGDDSWYKKEVTSEDLLSPAELGLKVIDPVSFEVATTKGLPAEEQYTTPPNETPVKV